MKKNLLLLFCVVALITSCLASCDALGGNGGGNNDGCEHTFSAEWDYDAKTHWHPAECEHGELKDGLADHVDADENGACDVCEYETGHIHTYESEWSMDDTHHWKNPTCSHSDEKGEYGLHADDVEDGVCDVCASHVHAANAAGYCKYTDCGKKVADIDETSLEALIYAFAEQAGLINSGYMNYDFTGRSNVNEEGFSTHATKWIEYTFGKGGYTYTKTANVTSAVARTVYYMEGWYAPDGPEQTFGVVSEDGGNTFALDISDTNKLYGFYLALSGLADGHGAESVLVALYEASLSDRAQNLDVIANADENKLSFSFSTSILNVSNITDSNTEEIVTKVYNLNHYDVAVSLAYSDDYALTELSIQLDCYTNDAGALANGAANESDIDIDYDPDTDTYTFRDSALADTYLVTITQTVGERTEENPHPKSQFIPQSFEFYFNMNDETGELYNKFDGATITAKVRDIINLYVGDCTPAGTSLHYIADQVRFKIYKDGVEVANADDYSNETVVAMLTFAGEQRSFFIIPKVDGAYRFEAYIGDTLIKTVNIYAGVVSEDQVKPGDNEIIAIVSESYEWSNKVEFVAPESGIYYFNLPAGVGLINADEYKAAGDDASKLPTPYFDFNNAKNPDGSFNPGSFSLTLEEGQVINFFANAAKRGTYIITYFVI